MANARRVKREQMSSKAIASFPEDISDAGVWSQLPEEIVTCEILAHLPLASLLRLRTVCKEWKEAARSPALLQKPVELRGGEREWMLFVSGTTRLDRENASCVYDPDYNRWYKMKRSSWMPTLPSLPGLVSEPEGSSSMTVEFPTGSTGGGVFMSVCPDIFKHCPRSVWGMFWPQRRGLMSLAHMVNPVTRSCAYVPMFPDGKSMLHVRGVMVDAKARCFKVVAVRSSTFTHHGHCLLTTFVYDSTVGSWMTSGELQARLGLPDSEVGKFTFNSPRVYGVFVGSVLYCFTNEVGYNLIAYDVGLARWNWLALAGPDFDFLSCKGPLNARDRLLCVVLGWVGGSRTPGGFRVQVWEVDFARMAWTVLACMPAAVMSLFRAPVEGCDELFPDVVFCRLRVAAGQNEVYFVQDYGGNVVALDLRGRVPAWRRLPDYPYEVDVMMRVFCLDPWLDFGSWKRNAD